MTCDIVQNSKELFSAGFELIHDNQNIGQMSFQGQLGSMEGVWSIQCFDKNIVMECCRCRDANTTQKVFRPYSVTFNSSNAGEVFQSKYRAGFLKSFDYNQLLLFGTSYSLYPIGFGNDGFKCPIYAGNRQIALIEKPCVVYNDLHSYHITAIDVESALIAVLFCAYMYVNSAYKPGNKVSKSVEKNITKTTNKLLLAKYNAQFKENTMG